MAKRKRTKGQTTIYKSLNRKLKIEQQRTPLKTGDDDDDDVHFVLDQHA